MSESDAARRVVLRGGWVVDPTQKLDGPATVILEGGKVAAVLRDTNVTNIPGDAILDVTGRWILPGLIDLHTHLREPGEEHKETFESGGQAAAAGGFSTVLAMANTQPPTDSGSRVAAVLDRARRATPVRVATVGAVTAGLAGEVLTDAESLAAAGAVALSDDGRPLQSPALMRRALEQAAVAGLPLLCHEEDLALVGRGCMNEGPVATRLGLLGIPGAAEEVMVQRDLVLLELVARRFPDAALHLQHLSTAGAVRALREAKARGLRVTGEATPHHFTLTDEVVAAGAGYDTNAKMNPPLRAEADRLAVQEGLADGTLDAIATDHAPHGPLEKDTVFDGAANGILGLETALGLALALVRDGKLTRGRVVELFTAGPARIVPAFRDLGSLRPGSPADVTIVDPEHRWRVDPTAFRSRSHNSPFGGRELVGRVELVFRAGQPIFRA